MQTRFPCGHLLLIVMVMLCCGDSLAQVQIQSSLNFGVNAAETVADPKNPERALGWVGQTGANRCIVEVFGAKGGKMIPAVNWPQGSNVIQGTLQVTVPAGKELALLHLHRTSA